MPKRKIVLIDDDLLMGKTITQMLKSYMNCEIKFYSDIKKAMKKIRKYQPDIVLMDWVMPQASGIDLVEELKEDEKTKDISIFMMTQKNKGEDFLRACNSGVDGYFTKPADMLYIKNSLISHINSKNKN